MDQTGLYYVIGVIAAFSVFAATLACISWWSKG